MIGTMSEHLPFPNNLILRQLLKPALTDRVLKAMGSKGETLYPMLHNTAAVIGIKGGEQIIATPAKVEITLGAGLLPGFRVEDFLNELNRIIGGDVELEVVHASGMGPERPDLGLFDTLCQILREADPEGIPMPIVLTAPTDACNFAQLGIQTYGFQPMKLPPDVDVAKLSHAPDERIPFEALEFGTTAIYKVLQRFGK
jgi:acetylornithine deacetylase/succinyl-diaminopimelate desuccinylase-like protein